MLRCCDAAMACACAVRGVSPLRVCAVSLLGTPARHACAAPLHLFELLALIIKRALVAPRLCIEQDDSPEISGAWHGCLYTQALSAWLSAHRCGSEDEVLRQTVKRLGTAIARICNRKPDKLCGEIKSHTVEQYVIASHGPVWGGQQSDLLWKAVWSK